MKVNYKQMYVMLKQQAKALDAQLNPSTGEKINEIPEDFNKTGWDVTIEKVEIMLEKMKELRANKGNRLTPQFYRSIYNRALIGTNEINKLQETLSLENSDIDYESECLKLNSEIHNLTVQLAEKVKQEAEQKELEELEKLESTDSEPDTETA